MSTDIKKVGFIGGKFLPLHLGHIYAIIAASNKVDKLYVVLSSSKKRDRELCERDGIEYIPADVRLSWLGNVLSNMENIKVIHIEDEYGNTDYNWEDGSEKIKKAIGEKIDYVFSSEKGYDEIFRKNYPDVKHIIIDNKRDSVKVSATDIRKDLYKNGDKLPGCVKAYFTKKVLVVGTESCGKSTLVKKLAKFYNTNYVHEVGRDYCDKYSNKLTERMFDLIAMEHFLLQNKRIEESNRVLFVDTDAIITQYYLGMYFPCMKSELIEEVIKLQKYDLVLFLEPDVEWVHDGLRFAGEEKIRIENNKKLKQMFKDEGVNFIVIKGDYGERFNKARELVDKLLERENAR